MGDFKPADLFVGVIQLFAVLMPGAVLAAALAFALSDPIQDTFGADLRDPHVRGAAFLVASYVLGAFVFPVASWLDQFADAYNEKQREKRGDDYAFLRADELRQAFFGDPTPKGLDPMNTFSWTKAVLMLGAPAAFSDVQRYEAESKFFRSLVLVLPASGLIVAVSRASAAPLLASLILGGSLLLVWPAAHRYVARRRKSVEWACKYVVVLQLSAGSKSKSAPDR
jgi:hypothetical protein